MTEVRKKCVAERYRRQLEMSLCGYPAVFLSLCLQKYDKYSFYSDTEKEEQAVKNIWGSDSESGSLFLLEF